MIFNYGMFFSHDSCLRQLAMHTCESHIHQGTCVLNPKPHKHAKHLYILCSAYCYYSASFSSEEKKEFEKEMGGLGECSPQITFPTSWHHRPTSHSCFVCSVRTSSAVPSWHCLLLENSLMCKVWASERQNISLDSPPHVLSSKKTWC